MQLLLRLSALVKNGGCGYPHFLFCTAWGVLLSAFISFSSTASVEEKPFIIGELRYELGNQMFQAAAAIATAIDHGYEAYFPDLDNCLSWGIPENHRYVFWRLNAQRPMGEVQYVYDEWREGGKLPIPARPNTVLQGYFQCEKYFAHHKEEILNLFAPSSEVMDYLQTKYPHILAHPNTVAIHVRTYIKDYGHIPTKDEFHAFPGVAYYQRAVNLFPEDSLFILCSDHIPWCKANLSHLAENLIFIEGNMHVYDLYLMSLCKHNIMANSTFSWWSAYLNRNPDQVVVTPNRWFGGHWVSATENLILEDWIRVPTSAEDPTLPLRDPR
jgi:hypothetical protein